MLENTRDLLNLSYVQRWIIAPMDLPQSVAEHSFRVLVIVRGLHDVMTTKGIRAFDLYNAMVYAIQHDSEEVYTGDIPGTHKDIGKKWAEPEDMQSWEIAVKVADSLETWYWWQMHGNKQWIHPSRPASGRDNRDIRKIYHYCKDWPGLLEAVRAVVVFCMRVDEITLLATFPGPGTGFRL